MGTINLPSTVRDLPLPADLRVRLAAIYRTAANRLQEHGWIQGNAMSNKGRCAQQAIIDSLTLHNEPTGFYYLGLAVPGGGDGLMLYGDSFTIYAMRVFARFTGAFNIPSWNDAPERTADEVIKTFRACAEELEEWSQHGRTAEEAVRTWRQAVITS